MSGTFRRLCRVCGVSAPVRSDGYRTEAGWKKHIRSHHRGVVGSVPLVRCADCGLLFWGKEASLSTHSLLCEGITHEDRYYERYAEYCARAEELYQIAPSPSVALASSIGSFINTFSDPPTVHLSSQQMMHISLSLERQASQSGPGIVRQTAAPSPNASVGTRGRHRRRRANFFPPGLGKEALDKAVDHSVPREGGRKPPHRRPWEDLEDLPAKRPRHASSVGNVALVPSDSEHESQTEMAEAVLNAVDEEFTQADSDSGANCSDAEDSDGQGGDTDASDGPQQELADSIPSTERVLYERPGLMPLSADDDSLLQEARRFQRAMWGQWGTNNAAEPPYTPTGRPGGPISAAEAALGLDIGSASPQQTFVERRKGYRIGLTLVRDTILALDGESGGAPGTLAARLTRLKCAIEAALSQKKAGDNDTEAIAAPLRVREERSARLAFSRQRLRPPEDAPGVSFRGSLAQEFYNVSVPVDCDGVVGTVSIPLVNPLIIAQRIARKVADVRDRMSVQLDSNGRVSVQTTKPRDYRYFSSADWYANAAPTALKCFFNTAEGERSLPSPPPPDDSGRPTSIRIETDNLPHVVALSMYSDASRVASTTFGQRTLHPIYLSSAMLRRGSSPQSPGTTFLAGIVPSVEMLRNGRNSDHVTMNLDVSGCHEVRWSRIQISILQRMYRVIMLLLRGVEKVGLPIRLEQRPATRGIFRVSHVVADLEEMAHLMHFKGATSGKCNMCEREDEGFRDVTPSSARLTEDVAGWLGASAPHRPSHIRFLEPDGDVATPSPILDLDGKFRRLLGGAHEIPFGYDTLHQFSMGLLHDMWQLTPELILLASREPREATNRAILAALLRTPRPPTSDSPAQERWRAGAKRLLSYNLTDFFFLRKCVLTAQEVKLLVLNGLPIVLTSCCANKTIRKSLLDAIYAAKRVSWWLWDFPRQPLRATQLEYLDDDVAHVMDTWQRSVNTVLDALSGSPGQDGRNRFLTQHPHLRKDVEAILRWRKPKMHMLTHIHDSIRRFGLKAADTAPFEHCHKWLLKQPFQWSSKQEKPTLLVELLFHAWTGILGRTGQLSAHPLARAPAASPESASPATSEWDEHPPEVPDEGIDHGKPMGKSCSLEAAPPSLLRDIRAASGTRRRPVSTHPLMRRWLVECAQRHDFMPPVEDPRTADIRLFSSYKQFTSWRHDGSGVHGVTLRVPAFVAVQGGASPSETSQASSESGAAPRHHHHPFHTLDMDHDLHHRVWMGRITAYVVINGHEFVMLRYAVPATGSQWSTPPPHPDLGRFGVRCVRLSPARDNLCLEPVSAILSPLFAAPQRAIILPAGSRDRDHDPRGEVEELRPNIATFVFGFERVVHSLSNFL